jgi:choice-of-anchor C domain-containing protein
MKGMRARILLAILVCAFSLSAGPSDSSPNLIANPSFEDEDIGELYRLYDQDDGSLKGWKLERGSVDIVGEWWDAAHGHQSLDLNGQEPATISQAIKTEPGRRYLLKFAAVASPDAPQGTLSFEVHWAGKSVGTIKVDQKDSTQRSHHKMRWERHEFELKATDAKTTLAFVSTTDGAWGPVIDDISLTLITDDGSTTPPPSTRASK